MRFCMVTLIISGWLGVHSASGQVPAARPVMPYMPGPACVSPAPTGYVHHHGANCRQGYCGPEMGCCHHPFCKRYPCASYLEYKCDPLPPVVLSSYAEDDKFNCPRFQLGDATPHFPHYWYPGQAYPLPHDYGVRPAEEGGLSGRGRGL